MAPIRKPGELEIAELHEMPELRELADLLAAVWSRANQAPIVPELLRALSHAGAYVSAARSGGAMVGGLVAFLGRDPDGSQTLHSHMLGVLPEARAAGIGYALKQDQRAWAARRGIAIVTWTFDPLVRLNARFNLVRLGAEAAAYHEDFYGVMDDAINAGDPTDRLVVRWRVADAVPAPEADAAALLAAGAHALLRVGEDGGPVAAEPARHGGAWLCQVPEDVVDLRARQPELALAWRLALRRALGGALAAGRRVTGMARGGWYVLEE